MSLVAGHEKIRVAGLRHRQKKIVTDIGRYFKFGQSTQYHRQVMQLVVERTGGRRIDAAMRSHALRWDQPTNGLITLNRSSNT